MPINQKQTKKDLQNWDMREKTRLNRIAKGKGTKKDDEPSAKRVERMHPDDAKYFLHLAAALKLILGRSVNDADMPPAKFLLNKYLTRFVKVCSINGSAFCNAL